MRSEATSPLPSSADVREARSATKRESSKSNTATTGAALGGSENKALSTLDPSTSAPNQGSGTTADTDIPSVDMGILKILRQQDLHMNDIRAVVRSPVLASEFSPSPIVVKTAWQILDRATKESDALQAVSGLYGVVRQCYSWMPRDSSGNNIGTARFIPETPSKWGGRLERALQSLPPCRVLCISVMCEEGKPLDSIGDTDEMARALTDISLGLCGAYLKGFLHRDVSIGNALSLVRTRPNDIFSLRTLVLDFPHLWSSGKDKPKDPDWTQLQDLFVDDGPRREVVRLAQRLESAVRDCHLHGSTAVIVDFDLSAPLANYFGDREHGSDISGTPAFMSYAVHEAFLLNVDYLQTPLDDIWSLLRTAVWAVLYSPDQPTTFEQHYRQYLQSRNEILKGLSRLASTGPPEALSPIVHGMIPRLTKLEKRLSFLDDEHRDIAVTDALPIIHLRLMLEAVLAVVESLM
ncbi:hypothetical protein EXIGLDRAFT_139114 [Exidia glandulosa HHB12029]|uniref:Fungal-type protein kinase domain-containing protein n=1 Tax=Exidia glandulosa HHB12029 TaxID=1314781 RepID=A0A165FZ49_EXIGL|nr:hypothetical protein EXIGLDRAFT_139114 [Exidia glandulosa HHB12029]